MSSAGGSFGGHWEPRSSSEPPKPRGPIPRWAVIAITVATVLVLLFLVLVLLAIQALNDPDLGRQLEGG